MFEQCVTEASDVELVKGRMEVDSSKLMTLKQFCTAYPWPSESATRAYIFRAEELGISEAFVRVGRRVLILPSKFFSLIQKVESRPNQGGNYAANAKQKGGSH